MCGRFSLSLTPDALSEAFGGIEIPPPPDRDRWSLPRYNIAPTQPILMMAPNPVWARWSLTPPSQPPLINVRSETAFTRPSFKTAASRRRALVPADGFYEWRRVGSRRLPYHFRPSEDGIWTFAAIYHQYTQENGNGWMGAAVLTTAPNRSVSELHDRMPVVIPASGRARWLDSAVQERGLLDDLLKAIPDSAMLRQRVHPNVNSSAHDAPDCLSPVDDDPPPVVSRQLDFEW